MSKEGVNDWNAMSKVSLEVGDSAEEYTREFHVNYPKSCIRVYPYSLGRERGFAQTPPHRGGGGGVTLHPYVVSSAL